MSMQEEPSESHSSSFAKDAPFPTSSKIGRENPKENEFHFLFMEEYWEYIVVALEAIMLRVGPIRNCKKIWTVL